MMVGLLGELKITNMNQSYTFITCYVLIAINAPVGTMIVPAVLLVIEDALELFNIFLALCAKSA